MEMSYKYPNTEGTDLNRRVKVFL